MDAPSVFLNPMIQYGFAGFSFALLSIIVWLVRRLIGVLSESNKVISANTTAIHELHTRSGEQMKLLRNVHDKLISRPCIARGRQEA